MTTVPDFNEAASDHARNTAPKLASQRCGAKIRCGEWCRAPAVRGSGAAACMAVRRTPVRQAKTGTRASRACSGGTQSPRKQIQALMGEARNLLEEMR